MTAKQVRPLIRIELRSQYFWFWFLGVVTSKRFCSDKTGLEKKVLKSAIGGTPVELTPSGLDSKRQAYLYKEIREFCTPETRDLVCPPPTEVQDYEGGAGEPSTKKAKRSADK
jgi:hypothetical protein